MKKLLLIALAIFFAQGLAAQTVSPETLAKRAKRKNLTVKEWNTDSSKKSRWLDHLTVYDEAGRKIEEIEYNQFGQIRRETCEYDPVTEKVIKEVIYDDRNVSAGSMFSDADLLGVPYRIIVSPRNMKENCCEIVTRDKSLQKKVALDEVLEEIKGLLKNALE